MTTPEQLGLYRDVIRLKMQYWDALRALEIALIGEDVTDAQSEALKECVDWAAAFLDEDDLDKVNARDLDEFVAGLGIVTGNRDVEEEEV